jgi:hypothetical protein
MRGDKLTGLCGRERNWIRESRGDASVWARPESIQAMKRTRRILVARPGSRVDAFVIQWVREMMKVKREEINGKRIR